MDSSDLPDSTPEQLSFDGAMSIFSPIGRTDAPSPPSFDYSYFLRDRSAPKSFGPTTSSPIRETSLASRRLPEIFPVIPSTSHQRQPPSLRRSPQPPSHRTPSPGSSAQSSYNGTPSRVSPVESTVHDNLSPALSIQSPSLTTSSPERSTKSPYSRSKIPERSKQSSLYDRTLSPERSIQLPISPTISPYHKIPSPERSTQSLYRRSKIPERSKQLSLYDRTLSPERSIQLPICPSISPYHRIPSPGRSTQSPYHRTTSPEISAQSSSIKTPSPSTQYPHQRAPSSGRLIQSPYRKTPSPGRQIPTLYQRAFSPGRPRESTKPETLPSGRRARRRLFKSPSPARTEAVSPAQEIPPWYTALGHRLPPSPLCSPVSDLPPTRRETISPQSSPEYRSSPSVSPQFPISQRQLVHQTIDQRQMLSPETAPDERYFHASPGMIPQIIVTGDSFTVDEDVPPEFRAPIEPVDVEAIFQPSTLEGIPEDEQEDVLKHRFYRNEYFSTLEQLKQLVRKCMPHMDFRLERNLNMIVKALENYIEKLHLKIEGFKDEKISSKLALEAISKRAYQLKNQLEQTGIVRLNEKIRDLEDRLESEAKDNHRLKNLEINLTAEVASLRSKLSQLVELQPEERDEYHENRQIQDELRARTEAAEAVNKTLQNQLSAEKEKYGRALEYITKAHEKIAEICVIKDREYRSIPYGPEMGPLDLWRERRKRGDPNYGIPRPVSDYPMNPELVMEETVREITLMAEAYAKGEITPTPEYAQKALERWHDIVVEEIEKDKKYLVELTFDRVGYTESVLKEIAERDKIVQVEKKCLLEVKALHSKLLAKTKQKDDLFKKIKVIENNLERAQRYCWDITNLWRNIKYKYVAAVRKEGGKVYRTSEGEWILGADPPEIDRENATYHPFESFVEAEEREIEREQRRMM